MRVERAELVAFLQQCQNALYLCSCNKLLEVYGRASASSFKPLQVFLQLYVKITNSRAETMFQALIGILATRGVSTGLLHGNEFQALIGILATL